MWTNDFGKKIDFENNITSQVKLNQANLEDNLVTEYSPVTNKMIKQITVVKQSTVANVL